jgi:hypothetical protein
VKSWQKDPAFSQEWREPSQTEVEMSQRRQLRLRVALGVMVRAERFGWWKLRSLAIEWRDVLVEGSDLDWWEENAARMKRALDEVNFMEPLLVGRDLMDAVDRVFGQERKR